MSCDYRPMDAFWALKAANRQLEGKDCFNPEKLTGADQLAWYLLQATMAFNRSEDERVDVTNRLCAAQYVLRNIIEDAERADDAWPVRRRWYHMAKQSLDPTYLVPDEPTPQREWRPRKSWLRGMTHHS